MSLPSFTERYQQLANHVGWHDRDAELVRSAWPIVQPGIASIVDDFYDAIQSNPETANIITGGPAQIDRLKSGLAVWLEELFNRQANPSYLEARQRVGKRHVDIGLAQSYTNVAMARLRVSIFRLLAKNSALRQHTHETIQAVSKRMDLDLALIQESYHREYLARQLPVNQSRLRQQRAIVELGHRALSASQLEALFEYAVLLIADIFAADQCAILEWLPSQAELKVLASYGMQLMDWDGSRISSRDQHFAGRVLRQRRLVVIDDRRTDHDMHATPVPGCEHVVSMAGVPLWNERQPWGVLLVHTLQQRSFLPGDQDCLQAMANLLSAAIGRKRAESRVLQAERLAGIGQMITGIAHESRNALQRIQACTEMLQLELPDDPQAMHLIQRIEKAQMDLTRLFDEVRGYAAPLSLARERVDLRQLWRSAWAELQPSHRERTMELRDDCSNSDMSIFADGFRMTQVFRNLFENSIAAANDHVVITISVENHASSGSTQLRTRVRDNGPGFDPTTEHQAFDPFFTTRTKGTGLGLSISRRIVEAHGGSIEIESHEDPGACVIIDLPRGLHE